MFNIRVKNIQYYEDRNQIQIGNFIQEDSNMDTNYVISADGMIVTYEEWLEMRRAEMDR